MIPDAAFYKTCYIVPDIVEAATRLSLAFGFEWLDVPAKPLLANIGGEHRTVELRACITRERPRIHLISEAPGTPWSAGPAGAAHHVAYWVGDLSGSVSLMQSAGFTVECCDATDSPSPTTWAYVRDHAGVRVELLGRFGQSDPEAMIDQLPVLRLP